MTIFLSNASNCQAGHQTTNKTGCQHGDCRWSLFPGLQITRSDIRPQAKWAVTLVIANGHISLPQGFMRVCIGKHTHFITLEGSIPCKKAILKCSEVLRVHIFLYKRKTFKFNTKQTINRNIYNSVNGKTKKHCRFYLFCSSWVILVLIGVKS